MQLDIYWKERKKHPIGYVVPSKLDVLSLKEKTAFKFRVRKPSKNVFIDYIVDGVTVKSTFKPAIIPSEMEVFNLPKNLLENAQQSIVISMRAKE